MTQIANQSPKRATDPNQVDTYLEIDRSSRVTVYTGKVELGTGVTTSLAQIVAGELGVPFEHITMIMGDTALTPDQGTTAGSKTLQTAGKVLHQVASRARAILLERAAGHLDVPAGDLTITNGRIHAISDDGQGIDLGQLASQPFDAEVEIHAIAAPTQHRRIIGQSIPRIDLLHKFTGAAAFVQDIRLDGMLHGRVLRPHVRTISGVGATIVGIDDSAVKNMSGVVDIVRNGNFIGVVAEREDIATRASDALIVTWSNPEPLPQQDTLFNLIRKMPAEVETVHQCRETGTTFSSEAALLTASYYQPFQAHAPIAPSCAVADVRRDEAIIWSSSQGVFALREAIAPLLGMPVDLVRIIYRESAGCYGHTGADDVAADAALLSQAVGKPVRVQWTRQDEFAWEGKGPAMISDLKASLDQTGRITTWQHHVWTPTHSTRPGGKPGNLLAGQLMDPPAPTATLGKAGGSRNAVVDYTFPNQQVVMHWVQTPPLRPSALRSLGAVANTTANETFMDELAAMAQTDPVEFRLRHLDDPRAIEVIRRAATSFGWVTRPSPSGESPAQGIATGRGIAYARYENEYTYVAMVAEVEVNTTTGKIRVRRVVVAHDCGRIVNPDGVINQVEGNVIQGISRALLEEVTFDESKVTSIDWTSYHILGFQDIPTIEVELIDRPGDPSWGAGEPAICPVRAAISNAVFDATGIRLRRAPYTPDRVLTALSGQESAHA